MNNSISITSVLRHTFAAYLGQRVVLLSLAALTVVPVEVLSALVGKASPAGAIVVLIVDVVVIALFMGAVVQLAADRRNDAPVKSLGELLRVVRPILGQLVFVGTVAGLALAFISFVSSLLFVGLIVGSALGSGNVVAALIVGLLASVVLSLGPSLFLVTIWSVAAPIVVLERPGGLLALPRSNMLVRGHRRRTCAAIVILTIALSVAGGAIELAGRTLGSAPSIVAGLLAAILIAPVPALAATALYFELRGDSPQATPPGGPIQTPPAGPAQEGAPTSPCA
jgi:hypothetical protein